MLQFRMPLSSASQIRVAVAGTTTIFPNLVDRLLDDWQLEFVEHRSRIVHVGSAYKNTIGQHIED